MKLHSYIIRNLKEIQFFANIKETSQRSSKKMRITFL